MRYGKWQVLFSDDLKQGGTTPLTLNGAFYYDQEQTKIAGYLPNDTVVESLSDWDVQELTQQEFFDLAKSIDPLIKINEEGYLICLPFYII